jgi:hypothetical protein
MAETAQGTTQVNVGARPHKHVHHGRTLAAWVGTTIATIAFIIGGIAVVIQLWPLFWVSVGLLVVALIATKVLQVMGHGAY